MEALTQSPMLLGEGPLWHENGLIWVDIAAGEVWRHDSCGLRKLANDAKLTSIVPGRDGNFYATSETSFCRWNPADGRIENIGGFRLCDPRIRFNDGKADPFGNYWAGTMDRDCQETLGSLYLLSPGGEVRQMLAGVGISNGLAWSADGATLYFIDSLRRRVEAFDFDPQRLEISRRRTVLEIPGEALPDGMCIDRDGLLWVALWNGGEVIAIDPVKSVIVHRLPVPAWNVTSCCFGGAELDQLFITTASIENPPGKTARHPAGGQIFRCRPGAIGLPADGYAPLGTRQSSGATAFAQGESAKVSGRGLPRSQAETPFF
ncbi:MAG: hypothetical protein RL095_580 [Verrucomicrobiota bacterium]|jgi:sugar lactone lactonase YvrE